MELAKVSRKYNIFIREELPFADEGILINHHSRYDIFIYLLFIYIYIYMCMHICINIKARVLNIMHRRRDPYERFNLYWCEKTVKGVTRLGGRLALLHVPERFLVLGQT